MINVFITFGVTLLFVIIIVFLLKRPMTNYLNNIAQKTIDDGIRQAEERTKDILDKELKINEKFIEGRKDLIFEALKTIKEDINQSRERLEKSDKERIDEISNLKNIIKEHNDVTRTLQITTEDLKKVLSNNQLRGTFGQEVAEDLLKMAGFVKGQNYISQQQQETTGKKPDFTVLLPNKTKINIDVKFPFQALQKWQQTDNKEQQKQYLQEFKSHIKTKIKEVTTRDYINPEENTLDFVLMFIPNEMIFSFIYEKFDDIREDAQKNKVIMCGPFGFTAILRMIKQAYENFKYQKDLYKIISHIKVFESEYKKFSEELNNLGKKISSVSTQFDEVAGVRDRALIKVIEKIKSGGLYLEELETKQLK